MKLETRDLRFVLFLGGSLPGKAILHQRQLSLFGMICRLPDNVLHTIAREKLNYVKKSMKSWFTTVRDLCMLYNLPHPIDLLDSMSSKESFNRLVKSKIIDYWEKKLRNEASLLSSLRYFHPEYMSLCKPHSIWTSAKNNPYEVFKALVQATMLSGKYRTEKLCQHWSKRDALRQPVLDTNTVKTLNTF